MSSLYVSLYCFMFSKLRRTEEIFGQLREFVEEENKNREVGHSAFSITNLLGYLLHRAEYHNNKKLADIGSMLMTNKSIIGFDTTDAISLMHNLTLSKEQMRVVKRYVTAKGIFFPNTNQLLEARKKIRPAISCLKEFMPCPVELPGLIALLHRVVRSNFLIIDNSLSLKIDQTSFTT